MENDRSCLTIKWYIVSFLDHVTKEIVFIYEAITLFESEFDPREAVYCEYIRHKADSPIEELY